MCDTFVALGEMTANGKVILGKNSDREPNEAQLITILPAADHPEGSRVKCTYTEIAQVRHTHQVFLSKPFWIWGAEMGANQFGVVIGNEAVFSKEPAGKNGLIGMDFLRLALERAATAETALQTIIELLEQYGQGGSCGLTHAMYYHNSYLIADAHEAWILETVGRRWAAKKVRKYGSISNALTIGEEWDLASPDLADYALKRGWCAKGEVFSFSRCYSDFIYTTFADGRRRQLCTSNALQAGQGKFNVADALAILRSHGEAENVIWSPDHGLMGAEVCMHAGFGPVRGSQTTGSLVAEIGEGSLSLWSTATAAPCLSVFKPFWMDSGLPDLGPEPTAVYDSQAIWWRHELLHRHVLKDYPNRAALFAAERDGLEAAFLAESSISSQYPIEQRQDFTTRCFETEEQSYARWLRQVKALPVVNGLRFYHAWAWNGFNKQARLPMK